MLILDLPPNATQAIVAKAHAQDLSVSQYVQSLIPNEPDENWAWEYGKDLFGCWESGDGTLSQNVKTLVAQKVHEKYGKNSEV